MSVYERNGHWWYDFFEDGERHRHPCGNGCKSKTHAKRIEAEKRALALAGEIAAKRAPMLSDFAPHFLAWVDEKAAAGHYTPNGRKHYHYGVKLLARTKAWSMRLNAITSDMAATLTFPGLASGNQALRVLHRILTYAHERRLIRRVPSFKHFEDRERTAIIEPWLEDLILENAREPLRCVIIIMLDSFMRPSEVVQMRWEDIQWSRSLIFIPRSKTKHGRRTLGITSRMMFELQLRKSAFTGNEWVFPSSGSKSGKKAQSGHVLASSLVKMWQSMKARVLVSLAQRYPDKQWPEGLVLYSCRHTGATHYSDAVGNNQLKVASALGHSDLRTTRRYVHHADDSAQVMDNVLEMRKKRA